MGEGMNTVELPQPFGFYHILTDTDDLHFGYWPEESPGLSLSQAQTGPYRPLA